MEYASYHISKITREYVNAQKEKEDWLTVIHLPKRAPYLNPNERKVNQKIKSDVCIQTDSILIQKNKKMQYQNIWIKDLEDGIMTFIMTLDLIDKI